MYSTGSIVPTTKPIRLTTESMLAGRILFSVMDLKLRCSAAGCDCANFLAAKEKLRICDGCSHSWITHLFEKLLKDETLSIFDVCSLALYGTNALPIRLKIVIERLLTTLKPDEIDKILKSFNWNNLDLARGYMIQESRGGILTKWSILPREEEILILQQFLRFPSTRSLSFTLLRDDFPLQSSNPNKIKQLLPDSPVLNLSAVKHNNIECTTDDDDEENEIDDNNEILQPPVDLSFKINHINKDEINKLHNKQKIEKKIEINLHEILIQQQQQQQQQTTNCWNTINNLQLINTSSTTTGKRRVQCSVCLKTFCDKGALKIHFSAVHLREMHKCTVIGCNMMFSSRRSRNRHSANPNPKLHSPHLRRRISPHDGRTCQANITGQIISSLPVEAEEEEEEEFTNKIVVGDLSNQIDEDFTSSTSSTTSSSINSIKPIECRKDGARKRKLNNPVRLSTVPDDSNDDFCCYDDGTEVIPHIDNIDKKKNHLERIESLPIFSSNHSESISNDDISSPNTNSDDTDSIPIDKENPRRCLACGKIFQNHFGVKTHYQNVHLKLMHKCTVDGCNAAFPSKRSRDRHSANLNLHRKLLSTSDVSNCSNDEQQQRHLFNPFIVNTNCINQTPTGWNPFLPFPIYPTTNNTITTTSITNTFKPLLQQQQQQLQPIIIECHFCGKQYDDNVQLKIHIETIHSKETIHNYCHHCNIIFFSKKLLDIHSCNNSSHGNNC